MGLFLDTTDADTILNDILDKLQEDIGETLYPGDERRMFGEALAAVLIIAMNKMDEAAKNSLLRYAIGENLDAIGDSYDCERLPAEKAKTVLRFGLSEVYTSDITIPEGTRVATADGLCFATTSVAVIPVGTVYTEVAAEATEGGARYNDLLPNAISVQVDLIAYVDTARNVTTTYGGEDAETDDEYRERIRLRMSAFSTTGSANAYKYWARSADKSIADAYAMSPSAGVVGVYIVTTEGTSPDTELITTVSTVVKSDRVKPLGDQVYVSGATPEGYDIELTYYVSSENEAAAVEAIESESYIDPDGNRQSGALEKYRLWQDTTIERDINPDYLRRLLLEAGADRVEITAPTYTALTGPMVARFTGSSLTAHVTHVVHDD